MRQTLPPTNPPADQVAGLLSCAPSTGLRRRRVKPDLPAFELIAESAVDTPPISRYTGTDNDSDCAGIVAPRDRMGSRVEETVTIQVPHKIRQMLNRTPEELSRDMRLYSALMLFRQGKLLSGAAAEMAGLPRVMFLDLCAEYDIPVSQLRPEDLRREMTGD